MFNGWKTRTIGQMLAELKRLEQEARRNAEKYREDERSGRYSNEMLAERRQELAEGGMIYGQLKQRIAERLATEFEQTQGSSPAAPMTQEEITAAFRAANRHLEVRDDHLAIGELNRILLSDPGNAKAYYRRGQIFAGVQKFQLAADDFTRAIQADPDMLEAYQHRGIAYRYLNQHEANIENQTQLLRLSSENASAYSSRGLAHYLAKDYHAARRDLTESIRLSPSSDAYYYRAGVYMELGQYEQALADCEQSLKLRPDAPFTLSRIKEIKKKMSGT